MQSTFSKSLPSSIWKEIHIQLPVHLRTYTDPFSFHAGNKTIVVICIVRTFLGYLFQYFPYHQKLGFFFPVLFLSNLGAVYPMQWQQKKRVNTFLLESILKKIGITLLSVFSSLHILYYFTIL